MIATRSHTSSTSLRRCELRRTATPRCRSSSSSWRTVRRPAGSSALVGSSRSRRSGVPISAWAIPSRCCMPLDIVSIARSAASSSPTSRRSSLSFRRAAVGAGETLVENEELVCRVPAGEAEELGQVPERAACLRGERRVAVYRRFAGRGTDEAAGDLDERRFAGAVRPEQADELALVDVEVDALQRLDRAVPLRKTPHGKGRSGGERHAASVRRAAAQKSAHMRHRRVTTSAICSQWGGGWWPPRGGGTRSD